MANLSLAKCKFCGQLFDTKLEEPMKKHVFTCMKITKSEREKQLANPEDVSCFSEAKSE